MPEKSFKWKIVPKPENEKFEDNKMVSTRDYLQVAISLISADIDELRESIANCNDDHPDDVVEKIRMEGKLEGLYLCRAMMNMALKIPVSENG